MTKEEREAELIEEAANYVEGEFYVYNSVANKSKPVIDEWCASNDEYITSVISTVRRNNFRNKKRVRR